MRYNGGHSHDRFITGTLNEYVEFLPVYPEVECGLGTPRLTMHLKGDVDNPRLVTSKTGEDHTERMVKWSYRGELVPLVVPLNLFSHYVRKYDQPYLKQQTYLNPHPTALKLRNHA